MATAAAIILHPAHERQLGYATWSDDPAVVTILNAIAELHRIGRALGELANHRPDLNGGSELRSVGQLSERCVMTGYINRNVWRTEASGSLGELWSLLDQRRDAWIDAQLAGEGLRSDLRATWDRYAERRGELEAEAPTVQATWESFRVGALECEIITEETLS